MNLLQAADALVRELKPLRFGAPVAYVYNPLEYARASHAQYLRRYGSSPREIVLLGMNPGPWGMAQTGVPFGEIGFVRHWLGIEAPVGRPPREHPKRPIQGFACPRREMSGLRLWGWAREAFGTPERFFARFFVANYCPLCFIEASGRNRTPDKLAPAERLALFKACDRHLRRTAAFLRPGFVIGVGAFAEARARAALGGTNVAVGRIPHPSPASPQANRDWAGQAEAQLKSYGIEWG